MIGQYQVACVSLTFRGGLRVGFSQIFEVVEELDRETLKMSFEGHLDTASAGVVSSRAVRLG